MKKGFILFLVIILTLLLPSTYGVDDTGGSRVGISIYIVDGGIIPDDIRGNYIISQGLFPINSFEESIISSLSGWSFKYPLGGEIDFNGYLDGDKDLPSRIENSLKISDEYTFIHVVKDIIFIYTHNPNLVISRLSSVKDIIVNNYLDILGSYIGEILGKSISYPYLIEQIGGSIKIVVVETPFQGYEYSPDTAERIVSSWGDRPEYIGGFGYEPAYGHYDFLIYLSCRSEVFNYSYTLDEVLDSIDKYLNNIFNGDVPPVILEVLDVCIGSAPSMEYYGDIDNISLDEGHLPSKSFSIKPTLINNYSVFITSKEGVGGRDSRYEGVESGVNQDRLYMYWIYLMFFIVTLSVIFFIVYVVRSMK